MNEKSYVSLEQHLCLVCGKAFGTSRILLDRRLRNSMEMHTATGWGLCEEHRKLSDEGYVALIECDPERSGLGAGAGRVGPAHACRTGRIAHLKREAFARLFNVEAEAAQPCVFVEVGVIERLQSMVSGQTD